MAHIVQCPSGLAGTIRGLKDRVADLLPHRWKATFGSGFTVARVETSAEDG